MDRHSIKSALAGRLRAIRREIYGEEGGPELAARLGLPSRTWLNYESGVTLPADVLLRFLEITGTVPSWLLHGTGPNTREPRPKPWPRRAKRGDRRRLLKRNRGHYCLCSRA